MQTNDSRHSGRQEYVSPETVLLLLAAGSPLLEESQSEGYDTDYGNW